MGVSPRFNFVIRFYLISFTGRMVERFDSYSYIDLPSDKEDDGEGTPLIRVSPGRASVLKAALRDRSFITSRGGGGAVVFKKV